MAKNEKRKSEKSRKPGLSPAEIDEIVNKDLLNAEQYEQINKPISLYFDPRFLGGDNIPKDRGVLFVSNHSVWALADTVVVLAAYKESGRPVRSLGDRNHFKNPVMGPILEKLGMVIGDPAVCSALMKDGQNVIVFPGGQREVFKKRKEVGDIVWKERVGFIRLALENDYEIVPVGVVGGDETYDILADSSDYLRTPLGKWLDEKGVFDKYLRGKDELPPLVKGVGLLGMPKPARVYVTFGAPIRVSEIARSGDSKDEMLETRKVVEQAVKNAIELGVKARAEDPEPEGFLRRFWQTV